MTILIVVLAAFVLIAFIERAIFLHKAQIRASDFLDGIKNSLKKDRLLEAITICEDAPSPVSRVLKTALLNLGGDKSANQISLNVSTISLLTSALNAAASLELPLLRRRLAIFSLFAKISPILGLMGTLIALLEIFNKYYGSGSYLPASEFSAQIYNALISTVVGMFFCIFSWIAYTFLLSRVRAVAQDIDWVSSEILLFVQKGLPQEEGLYIRGGGIDGK